MNEIITIDGPVAVGKTTVAKMLAKILGYNYLDTGSMYRALSLKLIMEKININNLEEVLNILHSTDISFESGNIILDKRDVSLEIRNIEIERIVSNVARIPEIRKFMVMMQRKEGEKGKIVVEGRDCGSVIFPNAQHKFYLDASLEERARRRLMDEKYKTKTISLDEIKQLIEQRDMMDKNREHSPLIVPEGAIIIFTDGLTAEEVVSIIVSNVRGNI